MPSSRRRARRARRYRWRRSHVGAAASDANQRIIYNSSTGALYYDAEGLGGGAQVQFAKLGTNLAVTNTDFRIA